MEFKKDIHYSFKLENAVLGACMLETTAFSRVNDILTNDVFYSDDNKIIYSSILEMYKNGVGINILTVFDFVQNVKGISKLNSGNTAWYCAELTRYVVSTANLEYHSFILRRMWMEREVIKLTSGGVKLEGNAKEKLQSLTGEIQRINSGHYTKDWSDLSELIVGLAKHQDEMLITKGMGLTTGVNKLDNLNGGFFKGQMIIIGARPSVGKSAFMGQMAIAMAKRNKSIGIISLEMNNNEIAARLSSLETQTDFKVIFRNLFYDEDSRTKWYRKITDSFIGLPIYVTDKTQVTTTDIKSKAQKLKYEKGSIDCLFIDYLQLVSSENENKNRNRENEVSQISRMCKLMAKDLDIPVIVLCQLNRAVTYRTGTNRYPQLSDLRESGSLEQDADVVMFLHRDYTTGIKEYMIDAEGNSTENNADLIVRKWRNGESNIHIELTFEGSKMKFIEKGMHSFAPIENSEPEEGLPF
jgi:replicative DNA helicase